MNFEFETFIFGIQNLTFEFQSLVYMYEFQSLFFEIQTLIYLLNSYFNHWIFSELLEINREKYLNQRLNIDILNLKDIKFEI